MDDFPFMWPTAGAPADHRHDGHAHDDRCLPPARTLVQDLGDFSQFYGSGAALATFHHDEGASHDDRCLLGSGCLGLGLDSGMNDKVAPPSASLAPGFEFWAHHPAPYQHSSASADFNDVSALTMDAQYPTRQFTPNPTFLETASVSMLSQGSHSRVLEKYQDAMSEHDAESEADSHDSCDSRCPGSEGPCSAGTCDEATACREENCMKPIVAPDVAHSAFILQGISGARQALQEHQYPGHAESNFQQNLEDSSMDYFLTGQTQSFGQAAHYPFQQNGWPAAPSHSLQNARPGQSPSQAVSGHASSQGFSQGLHSSQGISQSLSFPQYTPASTENEQSFGLTQPLGMDPNPTDFSLDIQHNAQFSFANTPGQVYGQQTSLGTSTAPKNADPANPDTPQNGWYQASMNEFQFNNAALDDAVLNGSSVGTLYGQNPLNRYPVGNTSLNVNADPPDDYLSPPASRGRHSSSKSLGSVTDLSSPLSESATQQLLAVMKDDSEKSDAHICQWRLGNDRVCGQQFDDSLLLHKHIADAHINALEASDDHGFVCRWKGCDRLTNKKRESKRGFDTKSKIRRHIEIHTGPLEVHKCEVCGKVCASKQALNTHHVTHSEERPFKCPESGCGKTFKTKDSLTTHVRNAHRDEKRYICPICHKGFKDSSNFTKHKATHNEVKRYTCLRCGRGFCRRDQLFRHARKAYGLTDEMLKKIYPEAPRGARARREKR